MRQSRRGHIVFLEMTQNEKRQKAISGYKTNTDSTHQEVDIKKEPADSKSAGSFAFNDFVVYLYLTTDL